MSTLDFIIKRLQPEIAGKGGSIIRNINRVIMAEVLSELQLNKGVEVGVAEGLHAEVLCMKNPNLELHGVDAYIKYPGYEEYKDPVGCMEEARDRLLPYNYHLIRNFSMEALYRFKNESLDFVFIDGGHDFKNVACDIVEWSKKVRSGGIVYGHDYKRTGRHSRNKVDVKDVVDAYMYAMGIKPWFIISCDIKNEYFGQDNPCWMYIKP